MTKRLLLPPACCTWFYLHKNFQYFKRLWEACSSEIVEQWAAGRQFFNAYGPTEVTIWATVAQLSDSSAKPRLGPIANTQITWMLIFSLYRLEL